MWESQLPFVELHTALLEYGGDDVNADVLEGWLDRNAEQVEWIEEYKRRTNNRWDAATDEDLARLYASFRVSSVLLLPFQPARFPEASGVAPLSIEAFLDFHRRLGFQVHQGREFHPFFHEIIAVEQSADESKSVDINESLWPCLMLGNLLYLRAGVSVIAGSTQARATVADRSTLYWTPRRIDRPCNDLSHGWGHNSQWRTAFRRDYLSDGTYEYNVDGRLSLADSSECLNDLPRSTLLELVRNRCLVTTTLDDDSDLWPYDYSHSEAR